MGQMGFDATAQNGDPAQRQAQVEGRGEHDVRVWLESIQVDIGLVETVEQHQPIDTGLVEAVGYVGHGTEVGVEFDGNRQIHGRSDLGEDVEVSILHIIAGFFRIGRQMIEIQLQRISTGCLDLTGVFRPATGCGSIQTADDGDVDGLLQVLDVREISVRPRLVTGMIGEVAHHIAPVWTSIVLGCQLTVVDLLLEQREHDHGGEACVLHVSNLTHITRQG